MTIVRWDPFRDFGFTAPNNAWMPPVDIYQTGDHELVLKAELPDMSREDIDINVENFVLTIKGEKKLSNEVKEEQFHHVERRYGTFSRSFSLPQTVDTEPGGGRVQERRPDRAAAAARGSETAVRSRSTSPRNESRHGQDGQDGQGGQERVPIPPVLPFQPSCLRVTL